MSHANDRFPGDLRVGVAKFFGNAASGFTDNLNEMNQGNAKGFVVIKIFPGLSVRQAQGFLCRGERSRTISNLEFRVCL